MGKGGQQQSQAALPRGVVTHSYGTDAADTVSSKGASSGAASRKFQLRAGETVELLEQRYPHLDSTPYRAQMQAPRL